MLRPRTLPGAPESNVTQPQALPPCVEHRLIQLQHSLARDVRRRRHKLREAIVNAAAILLAHAGEQMPQRECISSARFAKNQGELSSLLDESFRAKIESRKRLAKPLRGIFVIRGARPHVRAGGQSG